MKERLSVPIGSDWARDIVLAICTRNRAGRLAACIEKALAQVCEAEWGVLLVDSASTDETPIVLDEWLSRYPDRLRLLRIDQPGTGRARAAALRATTSQFLAFTDDDCYAEPDLLQCALDAFRRHPHLGMMGGRIMLHDPNDYPITICESLEYCEIGPRRLVRAGFIHGANMTFRRIALEDAGGFDERVGPGTPFCCEDIDIAARVNAAGWPIAYVPEPTVRHHHGRQASSDVSALRKYYDRGRGAFYMKMILAGQWRYLRYWAYTIRKYPKGMSLQELIGGIHFLVSAKKRAVGDTPPATSPSIVARGTTSHSANRPPTPE